jgi:hypothetical protein
MADTEAESSNAADADAAVVIVKLSRNERVKARCRTDPEYHEKRKAYYRTIMQARYHTEKEVERRKSRAYLETKILFYQKQLDLLPPAPPAAAFI